MTMEFLLQLPPLESGDRLLAGDLSAVLTLLQQGIVTPDHTAFVAQLQQPTA